MFATLKAFLCMMGSSSPYGFDDGYLRKDIQCKTLHIARFNPIRKSSPSIKAAAKAHKTNSIIFPLAIIGLCFSSIQFAMPSPSAWLLTPETNEQCVALPKSHCYFASTYCLSSAPPFRLFGEIPKIVVKSDNSTRKREKVVRGEGLEACCSSRPGG
jgi:hypothetical protein